MIKFVYFDVGGVIIKDFSGTNKWKELKNSMGVKPNLEKDFDEIFDKYEPGVCTGRDIETLVPILQRALNLSFPKGYSFLLDFVNRFERNTSIWPLLGKLKKKHKVGLLTNMYPNMLKEIYTACLMPKISWDIDEILFIENSARHVDVARKFGWKTFLYDSKNTSESNSCLEKLFILEK